MSVSPYIVTLPLDCVECLSSQGDQYDNANYWLKDKIVKEQLSSISRDTMIKELLETGAWNEEELSESSDIEISIKFIWILACSGQENMKDSN